MAKVDTAQAISEKFGRPALDPEQFTGKKLDALLACETPEAYDALLANLQDGDTSNDPPETQGGDQPQDSSAPAEQAGVSAAESTPPTPPETTVTKPQDSSEAETIKVRVNYEDEKLNLSENTSYLHPTTKTLIHGADFVEVPDDAFTQDLLSGRYLTIKAVRK